MSQNNEIFSPEFIPYYIEEVEKYHLTPTEGILYGFIRFYLKRENQWFYFTSQQIADILKTTANMINKSLTRLERKGLIERETTRYSGGSKRLLRLSGTLPNGKNPPYQMVNSTLPNGKVKKNTKKEYIKKNTIPKGIEQSSQEKTINISKNEEIENSLDIPKTEIQEQEKEKKVPAEKSEKSVPQEYWDSQINSMYALLKKAVWVDEFTETQKWQRVYAKHFLNWWVKNGREELILRLKSILEDPYKQKRSNSIAFLYNEVKAYIHSPVVQTNRKNSNVTFW